MLLALRARLRHGLTTLYFRDVVRPQILKTPPVTGLDDTSAEIHVLTSADDWLNLVWTLKSFYAVSPRRLQLCIHGDATLPAEAVTDLYHHFPEARIIQAAEADATVLPTLRACSNCHSFRSRNTLARKVFDFRHFLEGDRIALFDSDLLFFSAPEAWLSYLDTPERRVNTFNGDVGTAYAIPREILLAYGAEVIEDVNSGFGLIHRDSLRLDWLEEFLSIPGLIDGHFWRIEQTLFALCNTRFGAEPLPEEYRVYLGSGLEERPFRHYVGAVRHLMYAEGMRFLAPRLLK
jgi:hypothetical protein